MEQTAWRWEQCEWTQKPPTMHAWRIHGRGPHDIEHTNSRMLWMNKHPIMQLSYDFNSHTKWICSAVFLCVSFFVYFVCEMLLLLLLLPPCNMCSRYWLESCVVFRAYKKKTNSLWFVYVCIHCTILPCNFNVINPLEQKESIRQAQKSLREKQILQLWFICIYIIWLCACWRCCCCSWNSFNNWSLQLNLQQFIL